MSSERVFNFLLSLGLKERDARVYVFLSRKGSQNGKDLSNALKMSNQQVYRCLKSMRAKGLVSATFERPALFSAVSLEKVLDQVMKAKMGQAKNLQSNREELLSSWRSMIQKDSANS